MQQLSRGQKLTLAITATPMAVIGAAGAYATYHNMIDALGSTTAALGVVAAGEGAVLTAALTTLSLTLLGRHTPAVVRAALWILPLIASAVGVVAAANGTLAVVLAMTPLAMTVAGEGVALIARNIVAVATGVDLDAQRRSGRLLWHAARSQNGGRYGRWASRIAVWKLTRQAAEQDAQMAVQLAEVQRYRITQNTDDYLAAALAPRTVVKAAEPSLTARKGPSKPLAVPPAPPVPELPRRAAQDEPAPLLNPEALPPVGDSMDFINSVLAEAENNVAIDTTVELLTTTEVAAKFGVAVGTVRAWVSRGRLEVAGRDESGRSLFHPVDVAKLG